jgi:hypothetical protein
MSIDQMWKKFVAHQPFADKLGYGEEWKQMCIKRNLEAADCAAFAAERLNQSKSDLSAAAALAAGTAVSKNCSKAAKRAIEYINKTEY